MRLRKPQRAGYFPVVLKGKSCLFGLHIYQLQQHVLHKWIADIWENGDIIKKKSHDCTGFKQSSYLLEKNGKASHLSAKSSAENIFHSLLTNFQSQLWPTILAVAVRTVFLCNEPLLLTYWVHRPFVLPPTTVGLFTTCVIIRLLVPWPLWLRWNDVAVFPYISDYFGEQKKITITDWNDGQIYKNDNWNYPLSKSITHNAITGIRKPCSFPSGTILYC